MTTLYIVSTPIGNLQDITFRALKTLFSSDIILAEEVGKTKIFLTELRKRYGSMIEDERPTKIFQFNEFEENTHLARFLRLFESDSVISLISEAGTPLLSDPGFKLVREVILRNVPVIAIPGPSALLAALVTSGLPSDKFLFIGFPPRKQGKRKKLFQAIRQSLNASSEKILSSIVFYESPHRIVETCRDLIEVFGENSRVVLSRELTKKFEETKRGSLKDILTFVLEESPHGEYCIVLQPEGLPKSDQVLD